MSRRADPSCQRIKGCSFVEETISCCGKSRGGRLQALIEAWWAQRLDTDVVVVVSPLRCSAHQNMERMKTFLPKHEPLRAWTGHCTNSEQVAAAWGSDLWGGYLLGHAATDRGVLGCLRTALTATAVESGHMPPAPNRRFNKRPSSAAPTTVRQRF